MKLQLLLLTTVFLTACGGPSEEATKPGKKIVKAEKSLSFQEPDIKDDFCGVHINFQFCKCAFHNDYCDAVSMDKSSANTHAQAEFSKYVAGLKEDFASACDALGGFVDGDDCMICPEGAVREEKKCVLGVMDQEEGEESEESEENVSCDDLEDDWEKYSDIDWRIPVAERSYEANQYAQAQEAMLTKMTEGFELEYDNELLKQQLADIEEYRAAIVDNLRDNLVKATIRLMYVTYNQINAGKGAGKSFSTFLTSANSVEALGAGLKTVQAVIPGDSQLAVDTNSVGGKVGSVGWNATLEAIETMGDPKKMVAEQLSAVTQQIMKDTKGAVVPGANITDEEVDILREQHMENELLKQMEAEAAAKIAENEAKMQTLEAEIAKLQAESAEWKEKEKARTLLLLEDECE